MKKFICTVIGTSALLSLFTGCSHRYVRTATDIPPGNYPCTKMDWRYGAADIRIQTCKVTSFLMDRWYSKTTWDCNKSRPRIVITDIDNRTDCYISTDMIRDIIEGVAIDDGRFTVVVGDYKDDQELQYLMSKVTNDPRYQNNTKLNPNMAIAPQFLGKVRITKAVTSDQFYDYEEYRMTITLYDIETTEAIDSAWDVLVKKVRA